MLLLLRVLAVMIVLSGIILKLGHPCLDVNVMHPLLFLMFIRTGELRQFVLSENRLLRRESVLKRCVWQGEGQAGPPALPRTKQLCSLAILHTRIYRSGRKFVNFLVLLCSCVRGKYGQFRFFVFVKKQHIFRLISKIPCKPFDPIQKCIKTLSLGRRVQPALRSLRELLSSN
jgi:hypothetical protein